MTDQNIFIIAFAMGFAFALATARNLYGAEIKRRYRSQFEAYAARDAALEALARERGHPGPGGVAVAERLGVGRMGRG